MTQPLHPLEICDPQDILQAPDDALVCFCDQVTKKKVLKAMAAGARSLQDVEEVTGACRTKRCKELSPRKRCCSLEIKALLEQRYPRSDRFKKVGPKKE